ncbi:MAG: ATP-binding cassette domain-containing protein, partial [Oscillospiraceae bacterium]
VVREVGLEEDIRQMPMGLHTVLSEDSGTISGGQKQRVLVARAMVGSPRILFFDEATSALDNLTQAMVCESLENLKATRMVIAHRLSTVMRCDRIFVMEKGQIVEQGSYNELMEQKGRFFSLASRQLV